jgi:alpha/beta superfamily hydrolase
MGATTTRSDPIPAGSSWSDPRTGVTEDATFLGVGGQRILAVLHRPTDGDVHGAVVVCSSLYEDFQVNYRSELLVARALARRGRAVVRFHYRGMGNSDDLSGGALTFDTMLDDARLAASWLQQRTGATRLTVVGSRLGALVAAELASRDDHTPLVLWSPIAGADFFRGMSRASRLVGVRAVIRKRQVKDTDGRPAEDDGDELLGNRVLRRSREDLEGRALPATIGTRRRVLLVQLGLGDAENVQYNDLISGWTGEGALVDVLRVHMRQLWMVPDKWEPVEDRPQTKELVEGIAGWIADSEREPT